MQENNSSDKSISENKESNLLSYDKPVLLNEKDVKRLKNNNYDKISKNFSTSFVLKNKKTHQIVEIRAANSYHACNIIGWRPKNVVLMETLKAN